MASLVTYGTGLRRIDFTLSPNGPRRSVRLGRVDAKTGKATLARLETLIADKLTSRPHDAELCQWLGSLDDTLLSRLRAVGLTEGVGVTRTTLGDFLKRAEAARNVKESTRTFYAHTRRNLIEHFGAGRLLGDITEADADGWRALLAGLAGGTRRAGHGDGGPARPGRPHHVALGRAVEAHPRQPVRRRQGRLAAERIPQTVHHA